MAKYTTLFLDIGGVLLTNGWDRNSRALAAKTFNFDLADFEKRHALTFDVFETGKITLDLYLERAIFYAPRNFSKEQFKEFMYAQSQPYPEMIQLIRTLKTQYSLRTVAFSNEGRELMNHRINQFHMKEFIDFFICSAFIGVRKPDLDMYRMGLEIAHSEPHEVVYIDDRELLVEIGKKMGLSTLQHKSKEETSKRLNELLT